MKILSYNIFFLPEQYLQLQHSSDFLRIPLKKTYIKEKFKNWLKYGIAHFIMLSNNQLQVFYQAWHSRHIFFF